EGAVGVDLAPAPAGHVADLGDGAVADGDVGGAARSSRAVDHRAAADDEIVFGHGCSVPGTPAASRGVRPRLAHSPAMTSSTPKPSFAVVQPCPCGSGERDVRCCLPILRGEPAPTAEALMRSRYTAYVRHDERH